MIDLMDKVKVTEAKIQGNVISCTVICNAHDRNIFSGTVIDSPQYYIDPGCTRWTTGGDNIPHEVKVKVVEYLKSQLIKGVV